MYVQGLVSRASCCIPHRPARVAGSCASTATIGKTIERIPVDLQSTKCITCYAYPGWKFAKQYHEQKPPVAWDSRNEIRLLMQPETKVIHVPGVIQQPKKD